MPYQQEGVNWLQFLQNWGFGGLLADEMGLGKTVQVLAFFSRIQQEKPALVVVPTSLLFNWQREIEKFVPSCTPYIHSGKNRYRSVEEFAGQRIILTTYALLRQDQDLLLELDYSLVALDEGQMIKNPESQIAKTVYQLKSDMRLVITGTPIENRWDDLWSHFHFLMPDLLGERKEFQAKMLAASSDARHLRSDTKESPPFPIKTP